ncbi:phage tail tape measure protein [Cytobacillus oceanisediminis]|uniref:phage tail tape measure protein n=1 Tax=Cytobacillus oceanisediminis TaxID=665099 RepID=UPI0020413FC0|nr:phage tail tape measure protein [Cytobacillus oceanisediminis]MCM3242685.1 phage tail tape measure protein [Cytobacillus oceanisediminis]
MSLLGNLTVGILGNASGLSDSFRDAQSQVRNFGRQMSKIGSDLTVIGGTLTAGLTVPILGLGAMAVKSSIEFESAFAGVIKTVDATDKELATLRQGILDMSKEIPSTATEIASVAEAAGQLGIEIPNILSFTRVMSDLGVATNMGSQEAAMSLARLANITQMPQTEFDRLGSTIVHLGNNLATTEAEITEFGLRIAGAGAQIGLSEAEILAFGGALSSVGINAEAGGTAISRVMVDIANAVAIGGEDLAAFAEVAGMSSSEFKKAFETDAAGAIVTFIEGLGGVSEAGGNTFKVLEDLGMSDIRVRDALLRSAGAGDLLKEALELGNTAWEENNALTKEAEARYATTESQIQILKNRLDDVLGTIGDALVPALMTLVQAMEPIFQMIEKAAAQFFKLDGSIQLIIIAIAAIAAAIGPVLIVFGLLISSIGTIATAFAGLSGAIAGAGGVMAILTGPIGLIVAAIVGLGAVLITAWNQSEAFRTAVTNVFNSIKNAAVLAFGIVAGFIGQKFTEIKAFWDANGPQFLAAVTNVFNGIKAVIEFVMPAVLFIIEMAWTAIKQVIDGALNIIMGLVKVFSGFFTGDFSKMWEGAKQIFFGAIDLIIGWMTLTFVGGLRTLLTNLVKLGVNLIRNLANGIVNLFRSFTSTGRNLANNMVNGVLGFFRNLYSSATSIFSMLRNFGASIWSSLRQTITSIAQSIWQITVQRFTSMVSSIRNIFGTVRTTITTLWGKVMEFFRGIDLKQIGKDIIQGLINGIGSMASAVWEKAKGIASGIGDAIRKKLDINSPSRVAIWLMEMFGDGMIKGMDNSIDGINKAAGNMAIAAVPEIPSIDSPLLYGSNGGLEINHSSNGLQGLIESINNLANRPIILNINGRNFASATWRDIKDMIVRSDKEYEIFEGGL